MKGMRFALLLLLLLPTLAVGQTTTIIFDLRTGQTVETFLPPDTGYIYIERGTHAVLQLVPRDYFYYPQPLYDYRGCSRSPRCLGAIPKPSGGCQIW
jgi:hypothetical protein